MVSLLLLILEELLHLLIFLKQLLYFVEVGDVVVGELIHLQLVFFVFLLLEDQQVSDLFLAFGQFLEIEACLLTSLTQQLLQGFIFCEKSVELVDFVLIFIVEVQSFLHERRLAFLLFDFEFQGSDQVLLLLVFLLEFCVLLCVFCEPFRVHGLHFLHEGLVFAHQDLFVHFCLSGIIQKLVFLHLELCLLLIEVEQKQLVFVLVLLAQSPQLGQLLFQATDLGLLIYVSVP